MLAVPGSPGSSWAMYRARLIAMFHGVDSKICASFWLFGLVNNVLYVIILSSALDLVGPSIPAATVLLCDVLPGFIAKLTLPYVIHAVSYTHRIFILVLLSICGMLLIALSAPYTEDEGSSIPLKMTGVALASLSSGAGELSFLSLTHFYGSWALAAWASGTGAAGLVGAGFYAVATSALGLSSKTALLTGAALPLIMLLSFFVILPRAHLIEGSRRHSTYVTSGSDDQGISTDPRRASEYEEHGLLDDHESFDSQTKARTSPNQISNVSGSWTSHLSDNIYRARRLFFPFMLPLLLVYVSEYLINQSLHPILLFPLPTTPFSSFRSFYSTYAFIYQAGVFISRSSTPFIRLHNLYLPSFLQILNLALLLCQALFQIIPSVWILFVIIFWEGLLGGAVYVNTFAEISDTVQEDEREFSLGAVTVSDSAGIVLAGLIGVVVGVEGRLCAWQVGHGRDWCKSI